MGLSQSTQLMLLAVVTLYLVSWFVVFVGALHLSDLEHSLKRDFYGPYMEMFGLTPVLNTLLAIALLWELVAGVVKEAQWVFAPEQKEST